MEYKFKSIQYIRSLPKADVRASFISIERTESPNIFILTVAGNEYYLEKDDFLLMVEMLYRIKDETIKEDKTKYESILTGNAENEIEPEVVYPADADPRER